jgi:hypothetical protein
MIYSYSDVKEASFCYQLEKIYEKKLMLPIKKNVRNV